MPEVEEQLREYWTSVTAAQSPPTADDVTGSAPITERHAAADHGTSRSASRRQLLAAAAVVVLVVGAVTVYALISSAGDDDTSVTTDAPPAPEGREVERVDDPEPTALEQVDEGTDEEAGEEAARVSGTAAETWLPGSTGREVAIIPWRGGFLAILPLDGPFLSGSEPSEAETWESPDGVEWSASSNIVFPSGETIRSDGEHVVVIGGIGEGELPEGVSGSYRISASDDLLTWRTWDLVAGTADDAPVGMNVSVDIHDLQVLPDGWVAASTRSYNPDVESLLPPDLREGYTTGGGSITEEDGGLTISPDGGETVFLSWDDLGIDRSTFRRSTGGESQQRIVTAGWDGELVIREVADPTIPFVAGPGGALASDNQGGLLASTDLESWTDVPERPWGDETFRALARLPDGVVAVGETIWVGDADGTNWRTPSHPRLNGRTLTTLGSGFSASADGFVAIADLADYGDGYSPLLDPRIPSNDSTPPELVVIASPDGERWLVEDLDVGDAALEIWTLETIISGDRVLVHRPGEDVMVFEVE